VATSDERSHDAGGQRSARGRSRLGAVGSALSPGRWSLQTDRSPEGCCPCRTVEISRESSPPSTVSGGVSLGREGLLAHSSVGRLQNDGGMVDTRREVSDEQSRTRGRTRRPADDPRP